MAKVHNFTIDQGATKTIPFLYRVKSTGTAIDISSYTPKMDVRDNFLVNQATPEFTLTDGDGIDMTNASTGRITITINATRSGALNYTKKYKYDLELTSGSTVIRLFQGTITVDPQSTD